MSKSELNNIEVLNSPFSRTYLCPETEQIINCAMGLKHPINNIEALKNAFANSIFLNHPRFCSLMVRNPNNGQDQWKRTQVNIDDHFIIHYPTTTHLEEKEEEELVNAYLADLAVSTPLGQNKPLWEVHVLVGLKCVVLRVHHAIGDGVSLMDMLSTCFGQKKEELISVGDDNCKGDKKTNSYAKRKWKEGRIWRLIMSLWFTLVFGMKSLWKSLGLKDEICMLSGGDGVELWPRKIVTAKFEIEELKSIKMFVPSVTVNDVLLGIISSGLSKYISIKTLEEMRQSIKFTAIMLVNLRKKMSNSQDKTSSCAFPAWGNRTGIVLQPIYCCNEICPLDQVRLMKTIMDQKKLSYEAQIAYWSLKLVNFFLGPKMASRCFQKMISSTTLAISNIVGPSEEIAIADNPVSYIKVNVQSLPHATTLHMVSYAGKAELQVMVARDIITDPELLAKCFQDSFLEMKNVNNH